MQEISKIITSHTAEDVIIDEKFKDNSTDTIDNEKSPDLEIDEIWANDESRSKVSFADEVGEEEDVYSKRSFTPIWKKSDDEKPVWGDEEEGEEEEQVNDTK